jgi:hypothetical protein
VKNFRWSDPQELAQHGVAEGLADLARVQSDQSDQIAGGRGEVAGPERPFPRPLHHHPAGRGSQLRERGQPLPTPPGLVAVPLHP